MSKKLLVFGHGYTAYALSKLLIPAGWQVTGTTRNLQDKAKLTRAGVTPIIWPDEDVSDALNAATHVLVSIAPNDQGDPVLAHLEGYLARLSGQIKWLGYLSTTAVYGDHNGGWVDEETLVSPSTKRGQLRVDAENAWMELAKSDGLPVHIFRLAGIYGPGRGPFAKVNAGTARRIIKQDQVFNRIHVEDIANILKRSMESPKSPAVYNVCDDEAAPPQDVIGYAAELLGLPIPTAENFETADLSPMARSFYGESKRVDNRKVLSELGVRLKYPDYQTGLSAMLLNPEL